MGAWSVSFGLVMWGRLGVPRVFWGVVGVVFVRFWICDFCRVVCIFLGFGFFVAVGLCVFPCFGLLGSFCWSFWVGVFLLEMEGLGVVLLLCRFLFCVGRCVCIALCVASLFWVVVVCCRLGVLRPFVFGCSCVFVFWCYGAGGSEHVLGYCFLFV